jgi:hypothetical protein
MAVNGCGRVKRFASALCLCLAAADACAHAAGTEKSPSTDRVKPVSTPGASADVGLLGCWRATKIVLYVQDGTKAEDTSGRCTLQFKQTLFESTCKTTTGTATTAYRYQIVRPQVYATTMVSSAFKTDMIGSTREYEYRIDGDHLRTVSVPPAKAPEPPAVAAPRVETEAARVPCP